MSAFAPQPFEALFARAIEELRRERRIFDLPRRSFWSGREGLDLSVDVHGMRAATPVGPAAGPHTQLAQNLVLSWLAGGRALELKTVQANDRIEVARPCIDAPNVGYNVEWSQELTLEQSLEQYATGWLLIHGLRALDAVTAAGDRLDTVFEASVGYDLAGIASEPVARFLDDIGDAGKLLARLRDRLPASLRRAFDFDVPPAIASSVTLSTFHGCPADEIERIVEHLFDRHGISVTVKLNPTLLGHDETEGLLRGRLGYDELRLDAEAFAADLKWDQAVGMITRLRDTARRHGLGLGVKFTNTLVVKNHRGVFRDERMYLSGPPLHPIAVVLAARFARAVGGPLPISFSAGIDADNFHEAVACGFAPVTTCTDLLKPTGYRRLPRYLKRLEREMEQLGVRDVSGYVVARAAARAGATGPAPTAAADAARANLAAYASEVADDPRYHAGHNRGVPRREATRLSLFDCASCNACVVACPNDAFFSLRTTPVSLEAGALVIEGGAVHERPARFEIAREEQWAVFADFCNACGNCDTFCPEQGGPYRMKPRFTGSLERFEETAPDDAILVTSRGARVHGRFGGVTFVLERDGDRTRFTDGVIEAQLDASHRVVASRVVAPREGHHLPLVRYHALRVLADAVRAGVNPVAFTG